MSPKYAEERASIGVIHLTNEYGPLDLAILIVEKERKCYPVSVLLGYTFLFLVLLSALFFLFGKIERNLFVTFVTASGSGFIFWLCSARMWVCCVAFALTLLFNMVVRHIARWILSRRTALFDGSEWNGRLAVAVCGNDCVTEDAVDREEHGGCGIVQIQGALFKAYTSNDKLFQTGQIVRVVFSSGNLLYVEAV